MTSTSTDEPAALTNSAMTAGTDADGTATEARPERSAALDGIRGITIVLVVLGHTQLVWQDNPMYDVPLLRGIFLGGAVTVFFVIGGYLVSRGLLRLLDEGHMDPVVFYARRLVRLGVQLVPLLVVLVAISALDDTDPYTTRQNVVSSVNVLTFTFNNTLANDSLDARADLGHLWYLCVQQQVYLLLPFVLLLFHRHRRTLAVAMLGLFVLVTLRRFDLVHAGDWFAASVLTSTRSDGVLLGIALALVEPWLRGWRRRGSVLLHVALVALLVLVLSGGEVGVRPYLGPWGVAGVIVATALVAGIVTAPLGARGRRVLSWSPLAQLGRASLVIYVWHYPILFGVSRHTLDWTRPAQLLTMLAVLAVVTWLGTRYVEEPVRRFLRTNAWLSTRPPDRTGEPVR